MEPERVKIAGYKVYNWKPIVLLVFLPTWLYFWFLVLGDTCVGEPSIQMIFFSFIAIGPIETLLILLPKHNRWLCPYCGKLLCDDKWKMPPMDRCPRCKGPLYDVFKYHEQCPCCKGTGKKPNSFFEKCPVCSGTGFKPTSFADEPINNVSPDTQ